MTHKKTKSFYSWLSVGLLIALVVGLLPIGTVFAESTVQVQVDGLFVYEQPDVNSLLIAVLSLGSSIVVTDAGQQNGFSQVRLPDNRLGWAQLSTSGVPDGQIATTVDGVVTTSSPTGVVVQAIGNVRIRTTPSLNGERLGLIPWGATVSLISVNDSGDWYLVNYNGIEGWAASIWFRTVSGALEVTDGVLTSITTDPDGTLGVGGGGSLTVRSIDNVRIRTEPSLRGERIGLIGWGETATLLGFDDSGEWIQIDYNGLIGWSLALFFDLGADLEDAFIIIDENATVVTDDTSFLVVVPGGIPASSGVTVMSNDNVRVRAESNIGGERIGFIGWGDTADALAISANGNWLLIDANGLIGWVSASFFKVVSGNFGALPIR